MACLSGDIKGIYEHGAIAYSILGATGKRHCVFACIRSGSVEALRVLLGFGFHVPRQALVYIPSNISPQKAYEMGSELLKQGASARQCSWTGGTVIMAVLPHCWDKCGVWLLRRVIEEGAADAQLPEHSPARKLKTSTPGQYALVRAAITAKREWALAATYIMGRLGAMRAAARFYDDNATKNATKALVEAGCDPRRHAVFITAVGRIPDLTKGPTTNPYLPAHVRMIATTLFVAMQCRRNTNRTVLPYDILLLITECIPWD